MKKKENIIAFSLWGNKDKYIAGAEENFKLQPIIYPDWKIRLYCDKSVSSDFLRNAKLKYNIDIYQIQDNRGPFYGMYWRFMPHDDENVEYFISRDCDSRLNWREKAAVDDWLKSGKDYHIMRDHPHHNFPIQGGMWGAKANTFKMWPLIENWNQWDQYGCDQFFLANIIYPRVKDKACVHDPYFEKKPFPPHKPILNGGTFVGQIFDNGVPQLV